jgi:hypothetical protein
MLKNKYILFVLFCLVFGALGFFREYFFREYNNVMYTMYNGESTMPVNKNFEFFMSFSYKTVYYLKYIFTILFVLAFYLISVGCIKLFTGNRVLLKWFTYSYLVLFGISMVLMLWSYFVRVKLDSDEYSVSRWLMGIAQSPLPVLFFLATHKLITTKNQSA